MLDVQKIDTLKVYNNRDTDSPILKPLETDAAEAQVASLYYQSTLSPSVSKENQNIQCENKIEVDAPKKSWFGRTKDWLYSLFGIKKESTETSQIENEDVAENSKSCNENVPLTPVLEEPEFIEQSNLSKTIAELNQKLTYRLKEISEFEEEMRKTGDENLDKALFRQLIYTSLYQKNLKEESSLVTYNQVNALHDKNKSIQEEYYDLQEEINKHKKIHQVLHWTGIGLTAGIVGSLAAIFAIGGGVAVLSGSLALMSLAKGGTTLSGGILNYKSDLRTGKMHVVGQDSKATNKKLSSEIDELRNLDEDIAAIIKTIRHHLDNQSQAERAWMRRN